MITVCLGPENVKRKVFLERRDSVIDCNNDEMLPQASKDKPISLKSASKVKKYGRTIVPKPILPFSNLTIIEYIRYQRSLLDDKILDIEEVKDLLYIVGLKRRETTLVERLSVIEFRLLMLACKITEKNADKVVHLNFDGLCFTKKNKARLNNALAFLNKSFKLFVSLSDIRLAKKGTKILDYSKSSEVPKVYMA